MKLLNLLFVLFIFSIFSMSCENNSIPTIEGEWILIDYNQSLETGTDSFGISYNYELAEGEGNNIQMRFEFSENPNRFKSSGSYELRERVLDYNTLIISSRISEDVAFAFDEATWTNNNDTLTLSRGNDTFNFYIFTLNETRLKLIHKLGWEEAGPNPDIRYSYHISSNYTFSKFE